MLLVLVALGTATAMLATGQTHKEARGEAESKLRGQRIIQTLRGSIVDRNGVVLAQNKPGWDVAIHFDLLAGKWGYKRASADASSDKLVWNEMSQDQREARVNELEREYDQQTDAMLTTLAEFTGINKAELDERCEATVERVQNLQSYLWNAWRKKESEKRGEDVPLEQVAKQIRDEVQHHVVLSGLTDEQMRAIQKFIDEGDLALREGNEEARYALPWTMVQLRRTTLRDYPADRQTVVLDRSTLPGPLANSEPIEIEVAGVALHVIGMMRDVWKEDVEADPLRDMAGRYYLDGYADGDRRGRSGIEQSMEAYLRGARGLRTISLDSGETTNEVMPMGGRDVKLTMDIKLQSRVQAIMSPEFGLMKVQPWHMGTDDPPTRLGAPMYGGAVVIDIKSGDILAAVSMPDAPRDLLAEDPDLLWNDPIGLPMINRAFSVSYPPGSTVKPLVLAAAISDGVLQEGELIDTPGFLWPDKPEVYRDWYWKKYALLRGEIDGPRAIEVSSNPFFGLLAERLIKQYGRDRLPQWYEQFGLGTLAGIGLAEEAAGQVRPKNTKLEHNEVCFMAIGQSVIGWSPLQAAQAYMRLATGDLTKHARLIALPEQPTLASNDLSFKLTPTARRLAFEGMRRSANNRDGTTHHLSSATVAEIHRQPIFNVPGVSIMAKSGTADPGNYRWIDFNLNGDPDPGEVERNPRDHAWVIALVQPDGASAPTHAIACVVEYAGSGGQIAGPVVNQIIHALQHQGYLGQPAKPLAP